MTGIDLLILTGVAQGVILILAMSLRKQAPGQTNKYLVFLIALITLSLFSRLAYTQGIVRDFPRLALLPDIGLFVFGPTLYLYISSLIGKNKPPKKQIWLHYTPGLIHFTLMLLVIIRSNEAILELSASGVLLRPMYVMMAVGLVLNLTYVFLSYRKLFAYSKAQKDRLSFRPRIVYMHVILGLVEAVLVLSIISFASSIISIGGPDLRVYGAAWIFLTFTIYVLGFFAISMPKVVVPEPPVTKYQSSILNDLEVEEIKTGLSELMLHKKPYLNSRLTVSDLAKAMAINTSSLSRVINEGFGKNFFDFVNGYRINAFIELAQNPHYAKYTFVAISKEVGFNSKTTFNAAFKKDTGFTPRDYFKEMERVANGELSVPSGMK